MRRRKRDLLRSLQQQSPAASDPYAGLPEQEKIRRTKLADMRARGIDPYATSFTRTATNKSVRDEFSELGPDERTGKVVSIAGA